MPFETLSPRLLRVTNKALEHCRTQFGANGYRKEEEIDGSIAWRPTFYVRQGTGSIVAIEVNESLYPEVLKQATVDITHFDAPISVYQACPLDVFQADSKQSKINQLRDHGFGIITVDDEGRVTVQHHGIPLAQNISPKQLETELANLTNPFKVQFRTAHNTFRTNVNAGLQQASQIVEGVVRSFANQAAKDGLIAQPKPDLQLATVIDRLYDCTQLKSHRAAFGAARGFVKNYRNASSHPASSARQVAGRIRKSRAAFLEAVTVTSNFLDASGQEGYRIKTFVS